MSFQEEQAEVALVQKNITLNKSSGYRANGTFEVYGYFTYTTCSVEVISASGYVYLD